MKFIKLTQGKETIVDDVDFVILNKYKWYYHQGYATRSKRVGSRKLNKSITIRLHREILPTTKEIDHINGNTLDNRRCNLRICTRQQNNFNRINYSKNKFKGVDRRNNKWRARITFNKKQIHIGYFDSETEACDAYNKKALELFKDFAKLNKGES